MLCCSVNPLTPLSDISVKRLHKSLFSHKKKTFISLFCGKIYLIFQENATKMLKQCSMLLPQQDAQRNVMYKRQTSEVLFLPETQYPHIQLFKVGLEVMTDMVSLLPKVPIFKQ